MQMDIKGKAKQKHLMSDKLDFKPKTVTGDKEEHYIIIKWPIKPEDLTILNIYGPNLGAPKYIIQS